VRKKDSRKDEGVTRRNFLKTTGAGLLAPNVGLALSGASEPAPTTAAQFSPAGELTRISDNLYVFRDTCNVYVLKDGDKAILIDFGSGHVLNLLGQIGVTRVDAILHTHHHRDQCQGDGRAAAQRIPIYCPTHERHLFEDAEGFWHRRRIFDLYEVRNDFFTLTRNVPITGGLRDYDKHPWGPYELLIFPTPGHTIGSISLVGQVDGKKVAFSGDLVHAPGKVVNLYEMQYYYGGTDGVDCAIYSLAKLRELGPELVCPSHGEPFPNPDSGMADLIAKLRGWCEAYAPESTLTIDNKPFAVTPHLICAYQTCSTSYTLISDSGKALVVDYGTASGGFFDSFIPAIGPTDRIRFVEHTIPELKASYGLKSIDVAIPSHMHDDHLNGFPHLTRHYETKIWCFENMVDVLQNPRGYNLGCVLGEPIKIDRALRDGETFKWEEFTFTVHHSPGHTEYQMAMFGNIDGAQIAFTGDAFFPTNDSRHQLRHNLIFRNWVENDSHMKSIRTILEHEPAIVAPGHGKPFICNKVDLEELKGRLERQQRYFCSVIADPDCNFGLNPSWARLYPYQLLTKPGSRTDIELRVRNYRSKPMQVEAALVLPPGWKATPAKIAFEAQPGVDGKGGFALTIPDNWDPSKTRVALAADLTVDGKYLGEIAEAVAEVRAS
jgi:glyoxylase-like metal-dependent hydrolase (beta-lactamase superfamily II)